MSDTIQVKLVGKLTPDKFLEGAKEFFSLVQGVAKNVTNAPVDWTVEVEKSSAIVRLRIVNPSTDSQESLKVVCRGIKALRSGSRMMPVGFTRNEVHAARRLARLTDGGDLQSVTIQNGDAPELLQESVAQTAEAILEGQSQTAFGSVEGTILTLSAKQGLICTLHDPIHQREITCYLITDEAQETAHKAYPKKRVIVSGLIHYAREGHAVSITADDVRIFPDDSDLPTLEDVRAIYKLYN